MYSSRRILAIVLITSALVDPEARSATVVYFDGSQTAVAVASGVVSDTIASCGYEFTYSRDKLFTGGIGPDPIGRPASVTWPAGVQAQAVTAGPNAGPAQIVVKRSDGGVFDFSTFSAKLLANTAGAGGAIEIMPKLGGEDALPDPIAFDVTGIAGNVFSYSKAPNPWGSTSTLIGFDAYSLSLYVDFALVALRLEDASASVPGDFNFDGVVDGADCLAWQRGHSPSGAGPADLEAWQASFGAGTAITQGVPEPATVVSGIQALGVIYAVQALRRRKTFTRAL
jgi:hypothetical protein